MSETIESTELSKGWWAGCTDCGVNTIIDKGDSRGVPDTGEWDGFPRCLVCGGTLYFDEATETIWDREDRFIRLGRTHVAEKVAQALDATHKHGEHQTREAVRAVIERVSR